MKEIQEQLSAARPLDYTLGQSPNTPSGEPQAMAFLALSHTPVEHCLYLAMLAETESKNTRVGAFTIRRLMILTGLHSYSTIRRGLAGLQQNLSVELQSVAGEPEQAGAKVYIVYRPNEVFARRQHAGRAPYPKEFQGYQQNFSFSQAAEHVSRRHDLSRREAQVALSCAEGRTNAEIGHKLFISEQTVKFHLRHIFIKFGVKRRAELVSRLLAQGWNNGPG